MLSSSLLPLEDGDVHFKPTLPVVWHFLHSVLINLFVMGLCYANLTGITFPRIPFTGYFKMNVDKKTCGQDLKGRTEDVSISFLHLDDHYRDQGALATFNG